MNMLDAAAAFHRDNCRIHFARRAAVRALVLSAAEIRRLEDRIERLRPAFERLGESRYKLTVILHGRFLRVVYDTELKCLVTCLGDIPFASRPWQYGEAPQ